MNLSNADFGGIIKLHEIAYGVKRRPVFKIPYYQRPYEWDREHIENLISDFMKNMYGGTSPEYFVGATVLVTNDKFELEVVDGQQRVTTMYLLNMLRFMMQRALVEFDLRSSLHLNDVSKDLSELKKRYDELIGDKHTDAITDMIKCVSAKLERCTTYMFEGKVEDGKKALGEAISCYAACMGLSSKALSDLDYVEDCQNLSREFWKGENLSVSYSRDSFKQKLREALSLTVCALDSHGKVKFMLSESDVESIKLRDEVVGQYVESMYFLFHAVLGEVEKKNVDGRELTIQFIETIEEMVEKIEFCAVITGNEKDAYALFESLNDRNKAVDDLDLIKNLFLRAYYNKSGDYGDSLEKGLDEIDKIWNDYIFTKDNRAVISLLGAVYLTGDNTIDEKNGLGVRKAIDGYLDGKASYTLQDACNDIKIYKMIREILNTSTKSGHNLNKSLLLAENDTGLSITYKCIYLLKALKYTNVLSGLINVIISTYLNVKTGDIDVNDFKNSFLGGLMQSSQQTNPLYKEIHSVAYDMWRVTILAEDYKKPREYAAVLIKEFHKGKADYSNAMLSNMMFTAALVEFDKWLRNWHYNSANKDIRIKVLFLRLLRTSKDEVEKEITLNAPTAIVLTKPELAELDHLEPSEPDISYANEAYFQPPQGKTRDEIINGLGNFMLLDDYNNIKKSNCPVANAMTYYETMLNGNTHWLIEEIKTDIANKIVFEDVAGFVVPKEEFFVDRRNRLITYFKSLATGSTFDQTKVKY